KAACFTSEKFKTYLESLGIQLELNIAYQPECNGLRSRRSVTTGSSPSELMFGRKLRLWKDNDEEGIPGQVARMIELGNIAGVRRTKEKKKISNEYTSNLKAGETVLLLNGVLRKKGIRNKMLPRYEGPYKIIEQEKNNVFIIESKIGNRQTVHASRLIRYFSRAAVLNSLGREESKEEIHPLNNSTLQSVEHHYQGISPFGVLEFFLYSKSLNKLSDKMRNASRENPLVLDNNLSDALPLKRCSHSALEKYLMSLETWKVLNSLV
ncbi:hypothetical protein BB561_006965, partial [Smittium simulii]